MRNKLHTICMLLSLLCFSTQALAQDNNYTDNFFKYEDEQKTIINFHGLNFACFRTDQLNDTLDYACKETVNDKSRLVSPMPGKVVKINVKEGDEVNNGMIMMVVEAMKMENNIVAAGKAKVKRIFVEEGQMVDNKMQLIELE